MRRSESGAIVPGLSFARGSEMKPSSPVTCPCCSGGMFYRIAARSLVCDSCSMKLSPGELQDLLAAKGRQENHGRSASGKTNPSGADYRKDEAFAGISGWFGSGAVCPSCGAGLAVPEKNSPPSCCPECGIPVPFTESFLKSGLPDIVIPFEKEERAFLSAFRKRARDKIFVPERFVREAAKADLRAVFIPFWICDVNISGTVSYLAETVKPHIGNDWIHDVYECHAAGSRKYVRVPQNAGSDISDRTARIMEPFDFSRAVPFSSAWISGLYTGACDRNAHKCFKSVGERAAGSFEDILTEPEKYQFLKTEKSDITPVPARMRYALLPFWIADFTWDGHTHRFVMNGQTGKLSGNYPASYGRFALCEFSTWLLSGAGALELFGIYRHERGMQFLMLLLLFAATAGFFRAISVKYLFFGRTVSLVSAAVMTGLAFFLISESFWIFRTYPAPLVVFGLLCYLMAGMWFGIILAGSFVSADIPCIRRECDYCESKDGNSAISRNNRLLYTRKYSEVSLIGGRDGGRRKHGDF